MGRVSARIDVPGQASDAEDLWYDTRRWPAFVDGCKHDARVGQSLAVEDEKIRGTQRVSFVPHAEGVTVSLELDYELKEQRGMFGAFDLLFVRRPQRDSLQRTLRRFAAELEAERDPG